MSAPSPRLAAGEQPASEALTDVFKAIEPAELSKHEAVLAYWLSIRGNRELPPLRDLDPLEISGAASNSVLLELIGGGEDAEVRHVGEQLKSGDDVERIANAVRPSVLASIARKLSIVAISRNFLAFEDEFSAGGSTTRCWVTLLPLSAAGAWVDYVYAYVTFESAAGEGTKNAPAEVVEVEAEEAVAASQEEETLELEPVVVEAVEEEPVEEEIVEEQTVEEAMIDPVDVLEAPGEAEPLPEVAEHPVEEVAEPAAAPKKSAGFSFSTLAAATGFYGRQAVKVEPVMPAAVKARPPVEPEPEDIITPAEEPREEIAEVAEEPVADVDEHVAPVEEDVLDLTEEEQAAPVEAEQPAVVEEAIEPAPLEELALTEDQEFEPAAQETPQPSSKASEGTLQSKLTEVRAKADEARAAKLRANAALYDGLSAAYDFALDAEDAPEEYLRIVEGAGLKIQLRAPMRPVVKLAFDGLCDDSTIAQLEAVLAWAIDQDLPRGTLGQRIEEAGGIGPILTGMAKAA